MIIKGRDLEINLTAEELRHFKLDSAEDVANYIKTLGDKQKVIGFSSPKLELPEMRKDD